MAERYEVKLTQQAQEQLRATVAYIARELQAPETAERMLDALYDALTRSLFPARASLTPEEPWRSYGVRRLPVKNHLIYFGIDEDARRVQVTAILYGRRDQARAPGGMALSD